MSEARWSGAESVSGVEECSDDVERSGAESVSGDEDEGRWGARP